MRKIYLAAAIALVLTIQFSPSRTIVMAAGDIVVDSFEDGNETGECTLRSAIKAAILNISVNSCIQGSSDTADIIILPQGTYQVTLPKPNSPTPVDDLFGGDFDIFSPAENNLINQEIVLEGAGKDQTIIDGGQIDRIFELHGPSVTLVIKNLTIRNGNANEPQDAKSGGGAVLNWGSLMVENVLFIDNHTNQVGGSIDNRNFFQSYQTEFSNNSADLAGGAIYNESEMRLFNSLFTENSAGFEGGAILNTNSGLQGEVVRGILQNVTVSGNYASSGGGISNDGLIEFHYSTIHNNQGGEYLDAKNIQQTGGSITFNHTIISSTLRDSGNCDLNPYADFYDLGHNLENGNSCGLTLDTDIQNLFSVGLRPLDYYGGVTRTHALFANSPAVDLRGTDPVCFDYLQTPLLIDQREHSRPLDGNGDGISNCDSGAYELDPEEPNPTEAYFYLPFLIR